MASTGRLASRPTSTPALPPLPPGVHPLGELGLPDTLLAVPPSPSGALVVFFHGAGGHAASSLPLVRDAAAEAGALLVLPSSVSATWDLLGGGLGPDVAALDAALAHAFARFPVERVALAGFSDGGSYALSLGLASGDLAQALLAFSPGFAAPPAQEGVPRVYVSHGTSDRVLPVDRCGRSVVAALRGAGYEVRYDEFDGGHVVPPHLVREAFSWWLG